MKNKVVNTVEEYLELYKSERYTFSNLTFNDSKLYSYLLKECLKAKDGLSYRIAGLCYYYGKGTKKNEDLVFKYYKEGALLGDKVCLHNVGFCYQKGIGVAIDDAEAIKWYEKAIEQNYSLSLYALGLCYRNGNVVDVDYEKSLELIKRAADNNYSQAMAELGRMYILGEYVDFDSELGYYYAKASADLDNKYGYYYTGVCYENGIGVNENIELALDYYEKASKGELAYAKFSFARLLLEQKNYSRIDYSQIKALLFETSNLGIVEAQRFIEDFASQGDEDARKYLSYIHSDE